MKNRKLISILMAVVLVIATFAAGCGKKAVSSESTESSEAVTAEETTEEVTSEEVSEEETSEAPLPETEEPAAEEQVAGWNYQYNWESTQAIDVNRTGKLICIDAGHQAVGNFDMEPMGPGSSEMKMKCSVGTGGCVTGVPEYEVTLAVSLKLQAELQARGYSVVMCRTDNFVDLSSIDRAMIANDACADAFVRVHVNGNDDPSVTGAMTLCMTPYNEYNSFLYNDSLSLSACVLDGVVGATGCRRGSIWETDTMNGINWSRVPVTIIEMGYMSNPDEDMLLTTDEYQNLLALGIANGIDMYFVGR